MTKNDQSSTKRHPDHDYSSPGWYHLTLHTHGRIDAFGSLGSGAMRLDECGAILGGVLDTLPERYPCARIDTVRILPDRVDLLVEIVTHRNPDGKKSKNDPGWKKYRRTMTIPLLAGFLKTRSAIRINELRNTPGQPVWQRRYSDRVLRDKKQIAEVRSMLLVPGLDAHSWTLPYTLELLTDGQLLEYGLTDPNFAELVQARSRDWRASSQHSRFHPGWLLDIGDRFLAEQSVELVYDCLAVGDARGASSRLDFISTSTTVFMRDPDAGHLFIPVAIRRIDARAGGHSRASIVHDVRMRLVGDPGSFPHRGRMYDAAVFDAVGRSLRLPW